MAHGEDYDADFLRDLEKYLISTVRAEIDDQAAGIAIMLTLPLVKAGTPKTISLHTFSKVVLTASTGALNKSSCVLTAVLLLQRLYGNDQAIIPPGTTGGTKVVCCLFN